MISVYSTLCTSFFYNQYVTVQRINISNYSDFEYFIRDNVAMLVLFGAISLTIMLNLFHNIEHWVYNTKKEIKTKVILGYTNKDILLEYYTIFIKIFIIAFLFNILPSYIILDFFKLPTFIPLMISLSLSLIIVSIVVSFMLYTLLKKYTKGKYFDFKFGKIASIILQITISSVLVSFSLILLNDRYNELSPYKYYASMENGWILQGESLSYDQTMKIDSDPETYLKGLDTKISDIYEKYEDSLIVNFESTLVHNDLGSIHILNSKGLSINNLSIDLFKPYINSEYQPILLDYSFKDKYKVGDIIPNEPINYVVAKVLNEDERFRIVAPNDFGDMKPINLNIALFENRYLQNYTSLRNFNFINYLYFDSVNIDEMESIKKSIDLPDLKYEVLSIKSLQDEFNTQKVTTITSYLFIGVTTMLFSILGLIYIIHMDVKARENEFSIYKVLGYKDTYIYRKYAIMTGSMFVSSYFISQIIAFQTGSLSTWVSITVAILLLVIYIVIVKISNQTIKSINTIEVIGGENV